MSVSSHRAFVSTMCIYTHPPEISDVPISILVYRIWIYRHKIQNIGIGILIIGIILISNAYKFKIYFGFQFGCNTA